MKSFSTLVLKKEPKKNFYLDDKTVFHVFTQMIRDEYGSQGVKNIVPQLYQDRTLFISFRNSVWAQEIWLNRDTLSKKLNALIGSQAVKSIKVAH